MTKKTKVEILQETADYYSNNPRSLEKDGTMCMYRGPNGERCAFSRCCTEEAVAQMKEGDSAYVVLTKMGQGVLKSEYQGHSTNFWQSVQNLHDNSAHWENGKLSPLGEDELYRLLAMYAEPEDDPHRMNLDGLDGMR